jgi:hypothetical protein
MRKLSLALAAAAAFSVARPAAAATTIISENFETGLGVFSASGQVGVANGANYIPCCGATGNLTNNFVAFGSGGVPSGTISATFNSVLGQAYALSFDYGVLGIGQDSLSVTIGGISTTFVFKDANNDLDTALGLVSLDFVGTGAPIALSFSSDGAANADAIIDNILLATVDAALPEPATWAMMLLGFAGIGIAVRRRKTAIPLAR